MHYHFTLALTALALLLQAQVGYSQQPAAAPDTIAIGDLHGDLEAFLAILKQRKLINEDGTWSGGRTRVVLLGDYHDRGDDTAVILEYLMDLQQQAKGANGEIQAVLGNHELMTTMGDLRYVTRQELRLFEGFRNKPGEAAPDATLNQLMRSAMKSAGTAFKGDKEHEYKVDDPKQVEGFVRAHAGNGKLARWLRERPAIIQNEDTLYVHGGIGLWALLEDIPSINDSVSKWMAYFQGVGPKPDEDTAWTIDNLGPLWNRELPGRVFPEKWVDAIIAKYGVKRIVIGHTVLDPKEFPRDRSLYNGKVFAMDSGNSEYFKGVPSSLLLSPGKAPSVATAIRPAQHSALYQQLYDRFSINKLALKGVADPLNPKGKDCDDVAQPAAQ